MADEKPVNITVNINLFSDGTIDVGGEEEDEEEEELPPKRMRRRRVYEVID